MDKLICYHCKEEINVDTCYHDEYIGIVRCDKCGKNNAI
jgi:hypothetical protein